MDLWTDDVQRQVLELVGIVLGIVLTWAVAKGHAYLDALKAKTLAELQEKAGTLLAAAAKTGIDWVEQEAGKQLAKWPSDEKLASAVEFVQKQFPDVDEAVIKAQIEAAILNAKNGWAAGEATKVASVVTSATVNDVAAIVADAATAAAGAASTAQATIDKAEALAAALRGDVQ
jgi:hypothetical protein